MKRPLSGWGCSQVMDCDVRDWDAEHVSLWAQHGGIARGLGRAYGDSAYNQQLTVETGSLNRVVQFDSESGVLVAEGGLSLYAMLRTIVPHGWFVPVTPGTQFVTLGGMIAADVHGKNHHHQGSFAHCVDWIEMMDPTGQRHRVSREQDPAWFNWTCGGMGLTGVILYAQIRLLPIHSPWIEQTTVVTPDLEATMHCFESKVDAPYSVAWLDASARGSKLGRSVVFLGAHQNESELPPGEWIAPRRSCPEVPRLPFGVVNRWTTDLFNTVYYRKQSNNQKPVHWQTYFYPLDGLNHWNRVYGPKGFAQFQTVIPIDSAPACIPLLLKIVRIHGFASPVSVLKKMGAEASGISFPMPGYTLTVDLPNRSGLRKLMSQLIDCAIDHGGRFYLAKDLHLTAEQCFRADSRMDAFRAFREARGMRSVFVSEQSKRLGL